MKLTTIATLLASILALNSAAALAGKTDEQLMEKVLIEQRGEGQVEVSVVQDGDSWELTLDDEQLATSEQIEQALADLPEGLREKVAAMLSGKIGGHARVMKFHLGGKDDGEGTAFAYRFGDDGDGHHQIKVIRKARGEDGESPIVRIFGDGEHRVISEDVEIIKEIKFPGKEMLAEHLAGMIRRHDFSAEDLQKLQDALDAKP